LIALRFANGFLDFPVIADAVNDQDRMNNTYDIKWKTDEATQTQGSHKYYNAKYYQN
jgi:hypothetical protein